MNININWRWVERLFIWFLDRTDWGWIDEYYNKRRDKEFDAECDLLRAAEQEANKEMAEFIKSKGPEFKEELKESPILGLVTVDKVGFLNEPTTLDDLRYLSKQAINPYNKKSEKTKKPKTNAKK